MQLEAQSADRNVTIELSSAAKEWLAERGYDRLYGARPLARVIQEHIKKPLAEELLFGKLVKGGSVKVTLKEGKLDFEIIEAQLPALSKPDEDGEGGVDREKKVAGSERTSSPQRRKGKRGTSSSCLCVFCGQAFPWVGT
jgi:ATP-dependent Clp protease ATP-binding subunit ClpA